MIIQIAGTSGAGKSYVVRHLIANSRYVATIKQEQEPKAPSSEAGSRRGLGKMTRRKREIIGLTNERKACRGRNRLIPPGGFRSVL